LICHSESCAKRTETETETLALALTSIFSNALKQKRTKRQNYRFRMALGILKCLFISDMLKISNVLAKFAGPLVAGGACCNSALRMPCRISPLLVSTS
jgi:hypothetical protein